ncbi:MAG: hypothetical protein JJU16_00740 [Alkalibacterium sp.]|nr:hypothetical protein [Alkalibacterium sp.]
MKKIKITLILILISFTSACSNGAFGAGSNWIREAELTEREEGILATTSDKSLIFDFKMDNTKTTATIRIEKYIFGELIEEEFLHLSTEIENTGSITVTNTTSLTDPNQILLNVGMNFDNGTATLKTYDMIEQGLDGASSIWENVAAEGISYSDGNVILGSFAYSWNEEGMRTVSKEFYEEPEANREEIEEYELLYIIKAEFNESIADE